MIRKDRRIREAMAVGAAIVVSATAAAPAFADSTSSADTATSAGLAALASSHPEVLGANEPGVVAGEATQPTLSPTTADIESNGSLTGSTFGNIAADGFSVNSAVGPITFTPIADGAGTSQATIVNGTAALYPNVWPSTDLVVRPNALGASEWLSITSSAAPMTYSFDVGISSDQGLIQLGDGSIAITDGADVYSPPDLTQAIAQDAALGAGWSTTEPGDLPDSADDVDPTGSAEDGGNAGAPTTSTTSESATATATTGTSSGTMPSTTGASTTTATSQTTSTTSDSGQTATAAISSGTTSSTIPESSTTATSQTDTDDDTVVDDESTSSSGPVNEVSLPITATPAGDPQPQQTAQTGAAEATEIASADAATNGSAVQVIMLPVAVDANGQAVPVSMSVDPTTDTLTLQVTPGPDTAYPLLVDPSVVGPSDAVAAAQHKVTYGLSSEWPLVGPDDVKVNDGYWQDNPYNQDPYSTTPTIDPYLKQALNPKFTRITLPYDCPQQVVQTWLDAVKPSGLTPVITFEAPFVADSRNPDPTTPICTAVPVSPSSTGFPDHPDRAQYLAGVESIMQYAYQQFGVKYFAAWNEPDLHTRDRSTNTWVPGPNAVTPQRAAQYWDWATLAATAIHCAGCTIIAGEFSSAPVETFYKPDGTYSRQNGTTSFVDLYTQELAAMHATHPSEYRLPHVWSLHDYVDEYDGVRGQSADAQIAELESATHSSSFHGLTASQIWILEAGVFGDHQSPSPTPVNHVRQSEGGLVWRDLPNGYTNVTHLSWYEYFGPDGPGFDTGLVQHDINSANTPELPQRQPAYCGVVFQYTLKSNNSTCEGGAPGISIDGTVPPGANTTATVPLKINPRFWATTYEVDYQPLPAGTSASSSGYPPETDFAAGAYASKTGSITKLSELTAPQEVDVKLTGLQGCTAKAATGAVYEFRASAANYEVNLPGSPGPGGPATYEPTTRPPEASGYIADCLPKVSTGLTTQLTATSAAVGLDLIPKGSTEDTYYVEYGTDTSYGQTTTPVTVSADFKAQSDAVPLATLQPCTTYHYQAVATNPDSDGGTSYGGDQTFTTSCFSQYPLPTANASAYAITEGSDGAMWFAENGLASVGRIASDGTITEYPTPSTNSSPWGITAGPDGDVWTAEQGDNQVAKIDPTQAVPGTSDGITEYPLPVGISTTSGPSVIEAGPDGALWFGAQADTGYVGRITTTGQVTTYPVPDGAVPIAIAFGPGNTLWYIAEQGGFGPTELGSLNLSQATPGTSDGFTPTYSGLSTQLKGIALGEDGNIWVSDAGNNTIDKVTPQGAITPYPIPTSGASPFGITSGADGALWFSEAGAGSIGEITTSGQITEYPLPSGSGAPTYIASEPNGTLWFTEAFVNAIGSFTP